MAKTRRERYASRLDGMKSKRNLRRAEIASIAEHQAPYLVVWDDEAKTKRDAAKNANTVIINSTPLDAQDTCSAGMMAGMTSPSRQWFGLTVGNKRLAKLPRVKAYLEQCKEAINKALHESNWYDVLSSSVYPSLSSLGTGGVFCEHDGEGGIHFTPLVFGEYWIDANNRGEVDVLFRRLHWTVRQIVAEFGIDACSPLVKRAWERGEYNTLFTILHAVFPSTEEEKAIPGLRGFAFSSMWWEETNPNKGQFLRQAGYYEFPAMVPRWKTQGGDVYGHGPGQKVLGDCKALQHREVSKAKMVDKIVDPPMKSRGLRSEVDLLPGAITELGEGEDASVEPMFAVNPAALSAVNSEIAFYEQRINRGLFVHLWQAAIQDERAQRPTATEVEARRQEVMLMLGPLLQSLDTELFDPCIMRVFAILDRNDMLPLPPPELEGEELTATFISIMHQAQQSTGAAGLRGLVAEVGGLAQLQPEVLDKLNGDAVVDQFASMYGVSADVVRSEEDVGQMRQARQQQQAQQQAGQDALAATEGARNLAQVDPQKVGDIAAALNPVAGGLAGFGAP